MTRTLMISRCMIVVGAALTFGVGLTVSAFCQTAPAAAPPSRSAGPAPARQAIEARKAVFTLIAASFRPLGNVLKGSAPYDAATVDTSVARLVFLSDFLTDGFPDISNVGEPDTKAKANIWSDRADFDEKINGFRAHLVALRKVADADKGPTEAFKSAAAAVGQDCKACHDAYRAK